VEAHMNMSAVVGEILECGVPAAFEQFSEDLDAQWVASALERTGTASIRRRKLPADLVVWLVIAMALFRDRSILEVVTHLKLVMPGGAASSQGGRVVASSVSEARQRVGASPIRSIFEDTGRTWAIPAAAADTWRGLSLFAMDGSTLRIPDNEENEAAFGRPASGRSKSGYPQVRMLTLMGVRSHLLLAARMGPCRGKRTGELTLAKDLWQETPGHSLIIVDRGLLSYAPFWKLGQSGEERHWLVRAKKNLRWKVVEELADGSALVELKLSPQSRKEDPSLPRTMRCRAVRYQFEGGEPQTLLTSMLEPERFPASEFVQLYHERWEIENGYDELKTHMLERQEAIRSRTPKGVEQEVWGILLAYNLVRRRMCEAAAQAGVDPTRISFTHSLRLIRVFCTVLAWTTAPAHLPKRLMDLDMSVPLLVLPERRSERRYPRHVKIKMSNYKRNSGRTGKPSGS